jgi:hypothetical protein
VGESRESRGSKVDRKDGLMDGLIVVSPSSLSRLDEMEMEMEMEMDEFLIDFQLDLSA